MQNISNIIEEFILSTMGEDNTLHLSRNDMAEYFNCAPSQINYVLSTRFNLNRGFVIQSQRGGGGYIKIYRIDNFDDNYIHQVLNERVKDKISYKDAIYVLEDLQQKELISIEEAKVLGFAITQKSLATPINNEDQIRANILKNVLINIIKEN